MNMSGYISVWLTVKEYNDYMNGDTAIGWASDGDTDNYMNFIIPIEHIIVIEEYNSGSIEIDIKQK